MGNEGLVACGVVVGPVLYGVWYHRDVCGLWWLVAIWLVSLSGRPYFVSRRLCSVRNHLQRIWFTLQKRVSHRSLHSPTNGGDGHASRLSSIVRWDESLIGHSVREGDEIWWDTPSVDRILTARWPLTDKEVIGFRAALTRHGSVMLLTGEGLRPTAGQSPVRIRSAPISCGHSWNKQTSRSTSLDGTRKVEMVLKSRTVGRIDERWRNPSNGDSDDLFFR